MIIHCPADAGKKAKKIRLTLPRLTLSRSRGVLSFRYLSHGRVVIARAPRKRGPPKSPVTQQQVAAWDLVLQLIPHADGQYWAIAHCESLGTAFYARDIMIMAAYGNYISIPGWGVAPNGPSHP